MGLVARDSWLRTQPRWPFFETAAPWSPGGTGNVPRFAGSSPRSGKSIRGRTGVRNTPLAVRGGVNDAEAEGRARATLGRALGSMAPGIERLTVRFEDVNGPRNGLDTVCRIKAVVSGEPSVV